MWREVMVVKNAYVAQSWKELLNAEAISVRVVPVTSHIWPEAPDFEPRRIYVPDSKTHVVQEILRKI